MDGGKERVGCAGVERESSGMIAITNFVLKFLTDGYISYQGRARKMNRSQAPGKKKVL
jgi:hypothetical protein